MFRLLYSVSPPRERVASYTPTGLSITGMYGPPCSRWLCSDPLVMDLFLGGMFAFLRLVLAPVAWSLLNDSFMDFGFR